MKNSNDTIWNRTSDLPICSTALCYRGPHFICTLLFLFGVELGGTYSNPSVSEDLTFPPSIKYSPAW